MGDRARSMVTQRFSLATMVNSFDQLFLSSWRAHLIRSWKLTMSSDEGLRRSAITLALAGGVEYGLQLAIPIILVRYLDATAFGQYRLLWLLAGTALAIAPAFMPQSLFYFLPRTEPGQKRLIISNVLVYLIVAGVVVGAAASGWNPLLPETARSLFIQTYGISALFLALWVVASMLDVLPTADGRVRWQANVTIGVALIRTFFCWLVPR
ncbi:hypothetical protein ACFS07_02485 [Undibacterium arcticum]